MCAGNPSAGVGEADSGDLLADHPVSLVSFSERACLKKKERVPTVGAKDGSVGEALLCKWGDLSLTSRVRDL